MAITLREMIRKKVLGLIGLSKIEGAPGEESRLTFINDKEEIAKCKIREYNIWYCGDSDELLNFYTHNNTIEYFYEPFYSRNKKSYFWAVSSTESDTKRTHSSQPKNIIDTLVSIMGVPDVKGGNVEIDESKNAVNKNLQEILNENDFWNSLYKQEQLPMTMVEGWGCWKIVWDMDLSDNPIPVYYRAEDVDFIYKLGRIVGIIFKDYYTDGSRKQYLITETRYVSKGNLHVEKELFEVSGTIRDMTSSLKKVDFKSVDAFKHIEPNFVVTNYKGLLATPCVFYKDPMGDTPGRSLFAGKIELFDDLDQCLSQDANTVRKSTPVEYLNTDFLERDRRTGLPIQPKTFDRKYIMVKGSKNADGAANTALPVNVTQPNIDFQKYSTEAIQILLQIMNGLISPATLGIDVAKKDNAEAQREKEKVTIFTRNNLCACESKILSNLFSELLCAKELMTKNTITVKKYNVSVNFPEFADDSYESKIAVLGEQLDKGNISYEMYLDKLYGDKLTPDQRERELKFLEEQHQQQDENPFGGTDEGVNDNENGIQEGGNDPLAGLL